MSVRRPTTVLITLAALTAAVLSAGPAAEAGPPSAPTPAQVDADPRAGTTAWSGASSSTDVTLLTGQRVTLKRDAGVQRVIEAPAARAERAPAARLVVQGRESGGATTVTAVPAYALGLVGSRVVDPYLFDVGYLVDHGLAGAALPVTVRFATARPAAATASAARALQGATYVEGSATSATATVSVDHGTTFWAGVTRVPAADPTTPTGAVWAGNPNAPVRLAAGVAGLALRGAPAVAPAPALTVPSYSVRIAVAGFSDRSRWEYINHALGWDYGYLLGVAGPATGVSFSTPSLTCNQAATCDTVIATFRVPAGTYSFGSSQTVTHAGDFGTLLSYRPQVDVTHDIGFTLRADTASFTGMTAPRPTSPFWYAATSVRNLTDGEKFSDLIGLGASSTGVPGAWFVPSPPVSTGSYHLQLDLIDVQPPVTLAAPGTGLTFSPHYIRGMNGPDQVGGELGAYPYYAFPNGTRTLPVVYVGLARASSVRGKDVRGKLVLMRVDPDADTGTADVCAANAAPLQAAADAGAVGVLFDTTFPGNNVNPEGCPNTFSGEWFHAPAGQIPVPQIPFVTLLQEQAQALALEAVLRQHPVSLVLTAQDTPSFLLEASPNFEGAIPASVVQDMSTPATVAHTAAIHTTRAGYPELFPIGVRADTDLYAGPGFGVWHAGVGPYTVTEYLGPRTPDFYFLHPWGGYGNNDVERILLDETLPARTDYNARPVSYAPAVFDPRITTIVPQVGPDLCSFCRQGDKLFPFVGVSSGASPQVDLGAALFAGATLTRDGIPIPLASGDDPYYALPATPGTYVYRAHSAAADVRWRFSSSRPAATRLAPGTFCYDSYVHNSTVPCGVSPLVYTRVTTPTDLTDSARAGTTQTVRIVAVHALSGGPAIGAITAGASVDGGRTWLPTTVTAGSAGTATATFAVPPLARTNGFVTFRSAAVDAQGNSVEQTLYEAYRLR